LVSEALSAADIPFDGPSTRTRADCSGGRLLRHLLALSESDWTYHDVFDLLASVALQRSVGGPLCPTVEWERVARRAGVVGGQREWSFRLRSYGEYLAADAPREAELALDLANFVEELAATVAEGERVSNESWESVADWLVALIDRYLPAPEHQSHWSAAERSDLSGLVDGLARLAVLDAVDPQPSIASVRSAVLRELDVPAEPSSAGPGVMVSTIRAAYGHTIQRVVLLGANEGMLPHVGSGVGGRSVAEQHRELLAVLASTSQACVVAYSRGGLLDGRALSPSRWLAPIQRDAGPDALRRLKSFVDTGRSSTVWPTRRERVLNLLLNEPSVGDQLPAADAELRRGIESAGARRGRVPTRFEGLVGPLPSLDGVISPTRLEQYATCGFRSLLADVLGLVDEPHPQRLEWIDPRDRGSLVHAVAEKFFREVLQRAPQDQPAPEEPWSESDFLRIDELTQRELRSVERSGRTGRLGRWKFEQAALRDAMRQFLIEDERFRSAVGGRPIAVEYRFGRGADTPFRFPLGDGREIAVRGAVDRVDQIDTDATAAAIANESSPSTLVVIDYKTSKPTPPDALAEKMAAGQLVQLPLYGAAIRERLGISGAPVDVRYWHISDRGQWAHRSFDLDAAIELVQPALRSALDGIESGTFIADPGPPVLYPRSTYDHCTWCAFDRLCPSDRGERRAALTSEIDEPVGAQPRAASSEVER
jgi:RecB family exonuclease